MAYKDVGLVGLVKLVEVVECGVPLVGFNVIDRG